jgi:fatty acid amide hydrolase
MEPLHTLSATELLRRIDRGELSSREATQYFIDRIEALNPALNAVVVPRFAQALEQADRADRAYAQGKRTGPLHGLPLTIKECFDLPGTPTTLGLLRRRDDFPDQTDPYVAALQAAGGIVLGKTNVSQLLAALESANPVYGTTNNAFNPAFSCGGSSGGEGAIVGAGASPLGLGNDIGGSIRIPAAFNGVCGIKPTMARTVDQTRVLDYEVDNSINSAVGPLAKHAEDLYPALAVLNEVAATLGTVEPLRDPAAVDLSQLRVGYFLTDGFFPPMAAIRRAVAESVARLEDLGVTTVAFEPPDLAEAEAIFYGIMGGEDQPIFLENLQDDRPIEQLADLLSLVRAAPWKRKFLYWLTGLLGQESARRVIRHVGGKGAAHYAQLEERQRAFTQRYLRAMDESAAGPLDAIISPVAALPAFLHRTADKVGLGGAYCLQHNVTGFPAGVATVGTVAAEEAVGRKPSRDLQSRAAARTERAAAGMPLAVQIAARPWREDVVLALVGALHRPEIGPEEE